MNYREDNKEKAIGFLFENLVSFLNESDLKYALLGNPTAKSIVASDLDLCSDDTKRFESEVINFCKKYSYGILLKQCHATGIRYDLLFEFEGMHYVFPGPDLLIFPTWKIKGNIGLSYNRLLNNRVLSGDGYYKPSDIDGFIFYLLKRIDKGDIGILQMKLLKDTLKADESNIRFNLKSFLSGGDAELVINSIERNDLNGLKKLIPGLFNDLLKIEKFSLKRVSWTYKRIIEKVLRPTGLVICFLGADGAGKTAVGDQLQKELTPAFRRFQRFHLRPYLLGTEGDGVAVTDPHGKPARSVLASMAKLAYFWLDYTFGYWFKVRLLKVRSTLVIFDRYYHDLLMDPKRYRYGAPAWMARIIGKLIPKPDLFIILDAPAEVINARKQEVSLNETKKQRAAYLSFAKEHDNCIVLNTDQSLDETVHEGYLAVIEYMQKRQAKRSGINDAM